MQWGMERVREREKRWQRASGKAGAGSKRRWQQAAITAVAITAAARGVAQAAELRAQRLQQRRIAPPQRVHLRRNPLHADGSRFGGGL